MTILRDMDLEELVDLEQKIYYIAEEEGWQDLTLSEFSEKILELIEEKNNENL